MPNQKTMWTRCLGGFFVMLVTKLFISPVKKRIFCPKTTKFSPKLAILVILGQALPAHLVPCLWLWRAGCISQDTYLLNVFYTKFIKNERTPTCIRSSVNWRIGGQSKALIRWNLPSASLRHLLHPRLAYTKNRPQSLPSLWRKVGRLWWGVGSRI